MTKSAIKHDSEKVRMDLLDQIPRCPKCGNNRQVWRNQITHLLTCHRAWCDTVVQADDRWKDLP